MGNLVSAQEFANRLGISLRMLEELIIQGKVPPYIKFGRLRRWHPEQLDKWINEQFARAGEGSIGEQRSENC
ncbi:helix-turn-helix transcriptional regulator [Candidatus Ferrigenium straubiae]|jgi:excisionase family DNA binding protein|uniref:helix-turn-helix transcriptional regulator n=1 Tax=Candidatus Ferrigenium straubiae TaxID=2919506 RepID=UPI003F4ACB5A